MKNAFLIAIFSISFLASAQNLRKIQGKPFSKKILNTYVYNTKGDVLKFSEVINSFEEKIVYIDFWASWCSVCYKEMINSKKIQKKFEDKDVVFLYLSTDISSSNWKKALKKTNINGYHFRLEPKTKNLFKNQFKIEGIPYFMILDKKSNIFDHKAKWPRQDKLLTKSINKALNK